MKISNKSKSGSKHRSGETTGYSTNLTLEVLAAIALLHRGTFSGCFGLFRFIELLGLPGNLSRQLFRARLL